MTTPDEILDALSDRELLLAILARVDLIDAKVSDLVDALPPSEPNDPQPL